MSGSAYNAGLDQLTGFTTNTYGLLLVDDTYTFDRDHEFVDEVTAAELALSGYSRQVLGTKTRTVNNSLDRIVYDCADPNFGAIVVGGDVEAMILFRQITNDADSILIGYYPLGGVATTGLDFEVALNPAGLAFLKDRDA